MDITDRYPLITEIMVSNRDNSPNEHNKAYDDRLYKNEEKNREELIEQVKELLFKQESARPEDAEKLKRIFINMQNTTDLMQSVVGDYEFISGFLTCSKLFSELFQK